jgi:hypothetical protein
MVLFCCLLLPIKIPSNKHNITPAAAPMPIPAAAPVERPSFLFDCGVWLAVVDAEEEMIEDIAVDIEEEEVGEAMLEVEDIFGVGIGSPNFTAIVYRGILFLSSQQSVVPPQHHSVEEASPPQGVTTTSLFLWFSVFLHVSR